MKFGIKKLDRKKKKGCFYVVMGNALSQGHNKVKHIDKMELVDEEEERKREIHGVVEKKIIHNDNNNKS